MKKKILILGASSVIGSNIIYSNKNLNVTGLIRKPISKHSRSKQKRLGYIKKNLIYINQKNISKLKKYDVIINAIGLTANFNNKKYNLKKNKKIFHKYSKFILNVVKNSECKIFIHFGSSMEYSGLKNNSKQKLNENSLTTPDTKYGKFKIFEKNYFERKLNDKKLKLVFLRIFSIYGFFLKKKSLIHSIIHDEKSKIRNPNDYLDIINIKYLLKIIKETIKKIDRFKEKSIIINCTSNNSIKIKHLFEKIKKNKKNYFDGNDLIKSNKLQYIGSSNIVLNKLKLKKFNVLKDVNNILKNKENI